MKKLQVQTMLDNVSLQHVERLAQQNNMSVSAWIRDAVQQVLDIALEDEQAKAMGVHPARLRQP